MRNFHQYLTDFTESWAKDWVGEVCLGFIGTGDSVEPGVAGVGRSLASEGR